MKFTICFLFCSIFDFCLGNYSEPDPFGTKSSYFAVGNSDESPLELEGCQPVLSWILARHGTRNPGDDDILEMAERLPVLRDEIVAAHENGVGGLGEEEILRMIEWSFDLEVEQNDLLVEAGKREHFAMGSRWANRLSLISDPLRTEVRASEKSRAIESGISFLEGIFGDQTDLPDIKLDNHLLRFYKDCDKFQVEVAENEETYSEFRALEAGADWQEMVGRVKTKAGTEMASDLVRLVWDMCRFERAWYYYQDPEIYPVWCSLFSDQDLQLFQFSEDLKYYYDNGPVFNITTLMTQPMFEDIFSILDAVVDENYSGNVSILNFGHSDTVQPVMAALGLYYDGRDLLASDWGTELQEHQWKTSQIGPFAANVGLEVFKCETDFQIMMLQNEMIVESQPACGARVCTLAQFSEAYRYLAQVDFDEECRV